MRPEHKSQLLLGVTRSKAKMLEYDIPLEYHIKLTQDPTKLFTLSIGLLGEVSAIISRGDLEGDLIDELKNNLLFSARFFDSYIQSKLNETVDSYLMILGSASYYLCDLPGSASVLVKSVDNMLSDLDGNGLEYLLIWLLKSDFERYFYRGEGPFLFLINHISEYIVIYFESGERKDELLNSVYRLRDLVYKIGTPRQLLFIDVISAVIKRKIKNSVWDSLPEYSNLLLEKWIPTLQKKSFIKELWPAQHLLGKAYVLRGKSAIIQMPTSAGKTKATELILRSAFLAKRTRLAIIVAPFRALCHEIKDNLTDAFDNEPIFVDELSDTLQIDFNIAALLEHQQILVVTPEKLLYILRHNPEIASEAGLLIFDEGHQFDSGIRGITYELLLTSLRSMINKDAQKVLISAVISNADAIGKWLNGEANVVEGTTLIPTFRSVGFASWTDQLGRIEFVDSRNADKKEFYVPRVIERFNLGRKKKEKKDRFFPEKDDGQSIALFLGLKLVSNGSIAIFCGTKITAASICEKVLDVIERNIALALPIFFSDKQEVEKLTNLHIQNLGENSPTSRSAAYGIFSHHSNTPHGIRIAVEHAMRENLIRFVICTSTLAQGVNLPIRYLIVSGIKQGKEYIKVRDFHNLIGRAGRAGMHTEGSILFADPNIFDNRNDRKEKWRWDQIRNILEPSNSEPCVSNLLSIFDPIKSDDEKFIMTIEALDFVKAYIQDPLAVTRLASEISIDHAEKKFSKNGVEAQINWKISLVNAIESFLLSNWDENENHFSETGVTQLAEETLAFFLADDKKKQLMIELFQLIASNISRNIKEPMRRRTYGRTLYGVQDAKEIERWVHLNRDNLISVVNQAEIIEIIWPMFRSHIKDGIFTKFDKPEVLKEIIKNWISGTPFHEILNIINKREVKKIWGTQRRIIKIDDVVDLCESNLAYEATLIVSAICEFIEMLDFDEKEELIHYLQVFQKSLKYGLPDETTVCLYELGLSDRVIVQDLAANLNLQASQKKDIIKEFKSNIDQTLNIIDKYPVYFKNRMLDIIK